MFLSVPVTAQAPVPCEANDTENGAISDVMGMGERYAQTFTAHGNYTLNHVCVYLATSQAPANVFNATGNIYTVLEDGSWGSLLCSTQETFDLNYGPGWYCFYFDDCDMDVELSACEKYAFVIINGTSDSAIFLSGTEGDQYPEGEAYYYEGGYGYMPYRENNGFDFYFQVYGDCEETPVVCEEPSPPSTPTQPSEPVNTVGGDIFSVNKTALIAPWVALAVLIVAGGFFLYRRRANSMK